MDHHKVTEYDRLVRNFHEVAKNHQSDVPSEDLESVSRSSLTGKYDGSVYLVYEGNLLSVYPLNWWFLEIPYTLRPIHTIANYFTNHSKRS